MKRYESELDKYFFDVNHGLNSRFLWRFKTSKYTSFELLKILIKLINDNG
jgi:hypothetical protein